MLIGNIAEAQRSRFTNFNATENLGSAITTTDSSYYYIDSVSIKTNEAGVIEVSVIGYAKDTAYSVTGIKKVRFNKRRGTLTMGTVIDEQPVITDAALGTSTFDLVAASNKIYVRVKGKQSTTVNWFSITRRKSVAYF